MIGILERGPRTNSITMQAFESSNCDQPVQGWHTYAWDKQMCQGQLAVEWIDMPIDLWFVMHLRECGCITALSNAIRNQNQVQTLAYCMECDYTHRELMHTKECTSSHCSGSGIKHQLPRGVSLLALKDINPIHYAVAHTGSATQHALLYLLLPPRGLDPHLENTVKPLYQKCLPGCRLYSPDSMAQRKARGH